MTGRGRTIETMTRGVTIWLALSLLATTAAAQALNTPISRLIRDSQVSTATISVAAIDLGTGDILLAINDDSALIPASNMKLVSSGAALAVLSPDHVFRTEFRASDGALAVVGSGDPAFADPALLEETAPNLTVDALLDTLAARIAEAVGQPIDAVIVDDRVFDRERQHPSWDPDDVNKAWQAEVAGLAVHANLLGVYASASPDGAGARPVVTLQPSTASVDIDIRARTVAQSRTTAWVARARSANQFTLFGNVRGPARTPIGVPIHDPPTFLGTLLAERLSALRAGNPEVRLAEELDAFDTLPLVAVVTTPLMDIVRRCNIVSQNLYADSLLKTVGNAVTGEPGSFANGAAAVRMVIADRVGPDAASQTVIADGSGLSRLNRMSTRTLVTWLRSFAEDSDLARPFVESLAQPGEGTLRRWFRDQAPRNELRAKTGFLTGVRALSGYLIEPNSGRTIAFAIFANDIGPGAASSETKALQERIVLELDAYLSNARVLAEEPAGAAAEPGFGG